MSTEPDSSGRRAHESTDSAMFAEVFNRFAFDSDRRQRRSAHSAADVNENARAPDETFWPPDQLADAEPPPPAHFPANEGAAEGESSGGNDEPATYIRPYAWTGGRTKSNHVLELETLVSVSESCQTARLERLEHHSIANLCRHPRSVAEVGALLSVPLGVARVLLGDMADLGLITVHRTTTKNGSASHLMLMERVLSGLRRL